MEPLSNSKALCPKYCFSFWSFDGDIAGILGCQPPVEEHFIWTKCDQRERVRRFHKSSLTLGLIWENGAGKYGQTQTPNDRDYPWSSKNEGEYVPHSITTSLSLPYFLSAEGWGGEGDDIIGRIESQKASEGTSSRRHKSLHSWRKRSIFPPPELLTQHCHVSKYLSNCNVFITYVIVAAT